VVLYCLTTCYRLYILPSADPPDLDSFPTRRSSDLVLPVTRLCIDAVSDGDLAWFHPFCDQPTDLAHDGDSLRVIIAAGGKHRDGAVRAGGFQGLTLPGRFGPQHPVRQLQDLW